MQLLEGRRPRAAESCRESAAGVREAPDRYAWIAAAPFRAHLRHLTAVTGTPWPVLAVLARVSVPAARSLMVGRRGGSVHRVCPDVARRILGLTAPQVQRAAVRPVPAQRAVQMLGELTGAVSVPELADHLRLRRAQLDALAIDPPPATCTELVAASIEAAYRLSWVRRSSTTSRWAGRAVADRPPIAQAA